MTHDHEKAHKEFRPTPAVSAVKADGSIVELVFDPAANRTLFCIATATAWDFRPETEIGGRKVVPYSAHNNLIANGVVLLPSQPEEYGTEELLLAEMRAFIHRYVAVSPLFEEIATYYGLFTWVYDAFNEVPYLRVRGDYGSGKTRFLQIVGSLCYKPIFATGASTISPIFRILDAFRGTLIIDESDFRVSDERAEVVKILNNGNARGFPVLRSEVTPSKEFNPRAYAVFGPKIVATRGSFQDKALESRFLSEDMGHVPLREDIPINLSDAYKEEALRLRNKLLLFRFRNLRRPRAGTGLVDPAIEPRLNQVFVPLLSVIDDPDTRQRMRELARRYNAEHIAERGTGTEAQVLEIIRDLVASGEQRIGVKEIADWFRDRHGEEYQRKITARWIGWVIRERLHLRTQKSRGLFVVSDEELQKVERLLQRYGLRANEPGAR